MVVVHSIPAAGVSRLTTLCVPWRDRAGLIKSDRPRSDGSRRHPETVKAAVGDITSTRARYPAMGGLA